MQLRVPIHRLRTGMFLEAEVISLLVEGEFRSFLEPTGATYSSETTKRLRLRDAKLEEVEAAGGMMIGSTKQIEALREIYVSEAVVDPERSDVIPDEAFAATDETGAGN